MSNEKFDFSGKRNQQLHAQARENLHRLEPLKPESSLYHDRTEPDWFEESTTEADVERNLAFYKEWFSKAGVELNESSKVLEVGSGAGVLLERLRKEGVPTIGLDINPRANPGVPQVRARIEKLPFSDDVFDAIIAQGVFDKSVYPNQDQEVMLTELARVTRLGGALFLGHSMEPTVTFPKTLAPTTDSPTGSGDTALFFTKIEIPQDSGL